jgi:hypothetical protein
MAKGNKKENKIKKESSDNHVLQDGKINVASKYKLGGKMLNQDEIDRIVNKYKKK